jgi:plastocyanin
MNRATGDLPRRRAVLLLVGFGVALFVVGQALAAPDATVQSAPTLQAYSPITPKPAIPGGGTLAFENDTPSTAHSVTAIANGPDGKALFSSGLFNGSAAGKTRAVKGVQYLPAGNYKFHCISHPQTMKGTLTVAGGSPVARPNIDVSILSTKLNKVRRSGKLKVEADATTKSNGVALKARKGSKTLTHTSRLSLGAGQSKSLSLRLTKAGKKALKGLSKARVKLTGTVPFGAPAKASAKLQ